MIELTPNDSALDAFSMSLGFSFGFLLDAVQNLPDNNVNKPELLRYVERARHSAKLKNMDAAEGWLNALLVGAKSARLLIPLATYAEPFKKNAGKPKKISPIRKAIAKELKKSPRLKNRELWEAISNKPPRGWTFYDTNHSGKYAQGPDEENVGYPWFSEMCLEERNKIKG